LSGQEIQRRVFVTGLVQGVGFRASTFRAAAELGPLRGYVRNLPDGRVEAVFLGDETKVFAVVAWCRRGPPAAKVSRLEVIEETPDNSLGEFEFGS
jgi:acylphosphatase